MLGATGIIQGRDDNGLIRALGGKVKRKGTDLNDVHKITRSDGRLGVEGEEERGPRMTSSFLNRTTVWMALILTAIAET